MGGLFFLNRKGKPIDTIEDQLHGIFKDFLSWNDAEFGKRRKMAHSTALKANWKDFFQAYLLAYEKAMNAAENRSRKACSGGRAAGGKTYLCRHRIDTASLPGIHSGDDPAADHFAAPGTGLQSMVVLASQGSRPVRLPVAQNMAGDEQQSRDDAGDPVIGNTAGGIEEPELPEPLYPDHEAV